MIATRDEAPDPDAARRPLVILHLMKTGGFSLLYQVMDNVTPGTMWGLPEEETDELTRMARYSSIEQLAALDADARSRIEVVMGHFPFAIIERAFGQGGKHADAGLRLGLWLAEAGLPRVRGTRAEAPYGPIAGLGPMVRGVLASLAPAVTSLGLASAEEIAALQAEIATLEAANTHVGSAR